MVSFFVLIFTGYCGFLLWLIAGWRIAVNTEFKETMHLLKITVVVPFRNEEARLENLIDNFIAQDYPTSLWEVIFVNDHSTDSSEVILENSLRRLTNTRVTTLSNTQGKKSAITEGVRLAQGELVVTTDADCTMAPSWLSGINQAFQAESVKLAVGPVRLAGDNRFFGNLQELEFMSVMAVTAALISWGRPIMCNGANLAFRRSTFEAVNGYEGNLHISSGDDEFLLRKIQNTFPGSVLFLGTPAAIVSTPAQERLGDFIQQRLRWAGKWRYNQSVLSQLIAVFVLLIQFSFLILMVAACCSPGINYYLGLLLGVKICFDGLLLWNVSQFMKVRIRWIPFIVLQFLYPIYVIYIGLRSQGGGYTWKGRRLNHKL